ncbi:MULTISPECIES: type II secretion system F family protein [unclassified Lysobacter]|uniref:type II secretion system F family protein n=1 Tax=unclassified Lysobacter TaxID=2635362 RepID=UPI0006F4D1B1|nr:MULTISPECIES: type II secretion system F family protein [unclassified Lysobacter]KQZ56286.1 type II secretory pathway protein [Lysobacter sp. Root559]KRC35276.1 type II secretory pathway protein [Lysobacter sp. Root76]KRD70966.1 type II secretory pathway protein [Lysobacter sp. Root96]
MSATRTATKQQTPVRRPNPLEIFVWEGKDKRGVVMKGEQSAKNANMLRAELRRQGITPGTVKPKGKPLFGGAGKRITPRDIAIFSRQIATMMKSGVPIVTSLEIMAGGQKNPKMKALINTVRADLESGSSMHEALSKHPVQFDELYRNLVKAGESAGVLETVLDTVASYKENIESLKGKIKKALFYPATVVAVAILVSAILLIFVVPQFQKTFESFGAELPAFTLMIIGASDFMIAYWWAVLLLVIGIGVGFIMAKNRSPAFAHFLDRMMLKIPVVGQILHNSAIARFARTLAVTFKAGVPLVEALDTVAGATGNVVYETAVRRVRDDVSVGYQLNMSMKQVNLFPHMVIQMTAIGEEAGALDTMLFKVAEFYEEEVNNAVDALSSLLEPLIMMVLGVIVGSMVIGMYLPIFKLAATI